MKRRYEVHYGKVIGPGISTPDIPTTLEQLAERLSYAYTCGRNDVLRDLAKWLKEKDKE